MGSEKYKLKWSKYESNILSVFHSLLESETLSDVTLFCEGQTFKAHRLVLAACSPHFESLFSHTPVNGPVNNQFFVILDGTRADDLQILLHFMYRGEAYLHHDRINSVLRTAEALQVKGLSEGPKSFELNSSQHPTGLHGSASSSTGEGNGLSSSNPRSWSPPIHSNSEIVTHTRGSVGIMGNIKREKRDRDRDSQYHLQHHTRINDRDISPLPSHMRPGRPMSPDHGLSPPYGYSHTSGRDPPFGIYSGAGGPFRGMPPFPAQRQQDPCSTSYSPSRDGERNMTKNNSPTNLVTSRSNTYGSSKFNSPPPQAHGGQQASLKDEREDPYDLVRSTSNNGSGQARSDAERRTPSDKGDRQTPAHGSASGDFDRGSSRHSPSPAATPGSVSSGVGKPTSSAFPSDSTTDPAGRPQNAENDGRNMIRTSSFEERIRRVSDAASDMEANSISGDRPSRDYHNREEGARSVSPPRNNARITNSDDECTQAAAKNIEALRRIAQANVDRDRFMQGGLGLHPGLTNTLATTLPTASDYMRLALPVRDPDNGDAISGSGTKLRCPFCERTYGYETNLRAHIRQRHQGIRVSCPYCPRTFTRNNTVRRHVAREHRHLTGRIPTKFGSTRVNPDPIRLQAAAAAVQSFRNSGVVPNPAIVDSGSGPSTTAPPTGTSG